MTALIEIFFSALHGTVEGYDIDGNPILGEHECINDFSSAQLIRDLHKGAIRFVEDFNGSIIKNLIDICVVGCLRMLPRILLHVLNLQQSGCFPILLKIILLS